MKLSKRAVARLKVLADYMDNMTAKTKFNMDAWVRYNGSENLMSFKHIPSNGILTEDTLSMRGISACAAGWAATIPSFKKKGLKLISEEYYDINAGDQLCGFINYKNPNSRFNIMYDDHEAIRQFFGIDREQMNYLFMDMGINTPKQWAKRAYKFLETDGEM